MFVCKTISLANFLIDNGLNVRKVDKDLEDGRFVVFLFPKTKLWKKLMKEWSEQNK